MKSEISSCLKIGVTGGIGSGKSTVCKIIEQLGYPVFYSDQEAKKVINSNLAVIKKVKKLFGSTSYVDGQLNRAHIAEQAFENPGLLNALNEIIHPIVRNSFQDFATLHGTKKFVFNEAAILFETGAYKNFDFNILVVAPKDLRISRIMERDKVHEAQVILRMKSQWADEQKIPLANYVIQNSDDDDLTQQVKKIIENLNAK